MGLVFTVISLGGFLATAQPGDSAPAIDRFWAGLAGSQDDCSSQYDYFPSGGMRSFYCHARSVVSFDLGALGAYCGGRVFTSGPHGNELKLNALNDFGHYDPAFVRCLRRLAVPARGSELRKKTQKVYDAQVRALARTYLTTWRRMQVHSDWRESELVWLKGEIDKRDLNPAYYDGRGYYYFLHSRFFEAKDRDELREEPGTELDGNVVKTAVAFWLRRSLDGSAREFAGALEDLVRAYDDGFLPLGGVLVELLDAGAGAKRSDQVAAQIMTRGAQIIRGMAQTPRKASELFYASGMDREALALASQLGLPAAAVKPLGWKAKGSVVIALAP